MLVPNWGKTKGVKMLSSEDTKKIADKARLFGLFDFISSQDQLIQSAAKFVLGRELSPEEISQVKSL